MPQIYFNVFICIFAIFGVSRPFPEFSSYLCFSLNRYLYKHTHEFVVIYYLFFHFCILHFGSSWKSLDIIYLNCAQPKWMAINNKQIFYLFIVYIFVYHCQLLLLLLLVIVFVSLLLFTFCFRTAIVTFWCYFWEETEADRLNDTLSLYIHIYKIYIFKIFKINLSWKIL